MRSFMPSVELETMQLIWDEEFVREETVRSTAIRQAKAKDPAGFFMEMQRLRRIETQAWMEALKNDEEVKRLAQENLELRARVEALEEEVDGYRTKPGEVGEAEARVVDLLEEVQREYEIDRSK